MNNVFPRKLLEALVEEGEKEVAVKKKVILSMTHRRAQELGLLTCKCGHPENNHFTHDKHPCAHCSCHAYSEKGIYGVSIEAKEL